MVGFRYTEVNERGFFLNGRLYPLNGVGTIVTDLFAVAVRKNDAVSFLHIIGQRRLAFPDGIRRVARHAQLIEEYVEGAFILALRNIRPGDNSVVVNICLNCGDAHTAPRRIPDAAVKADAQLNGFFGAENVLDGREDTKWVGSRFDFEDASLFFTLPERTEVESVRILFDGAGDRAYDYRVWASAGGLRQDDFRLAAEVIGNKDRSGEAVVTIQRSIRYIRIEVLGCDEANASPAVCEVEILGYRDCTFTFVTGGGSPIDEAVYPLGAEVAPIPEREGYRFGGWFLDAGCTQPFAGRAQADTVLYAKWDAIEYTISFRSNGGTELQPLVGKAGDAVVLPVPTREGFTFTGWYADAQCTVRCEVDRMPEGGLILYAGWVQNADAADVPSEGCAGMAMGGGACAGVLLLAGAVAAAIICRRKGGLQK